MGPGSRCLAHPCLQTHHGLWQTGPVLPAVPGGPRAGRGGRVTLVLRLLWRFQAVECILCPFSLPGSKLFGGVLCAVGVRWGLGLGGGRLLGSPFALSQSLSIRPKSAGALK